MMADCAGNTIVELKGDMFRKLKYNSYTMSFCGASQQLMTSTSLFDDIFNFKRNASITRQLFYFGTQVSEHHLPCRLTVKMCKLQLLYLNWMQIRIMQDSERVQMEYSLYSAE